MNKIKEQKTPGKWFNGVIYDKGAVVQNRFGGGEIELNNVELSVYDFCIGASIVIEMGMFNTPKHVQDLRKGLDWFRTYNPEAYMVLLD
mgnify:FL=1|tara:strand:+ start:59 stop:325 length:267 start_codon:yes stop_codon:yes gene_type:complete